MTTFDNLPDELVEYIYKLIHKSRIENVHKELHSAFQVVYRTKFAALKSDKEIEAYMEEYEEERWRMMPGMKLIKLMRILLKFMIKI